jgi:serine/threonine-protein kinase
MVAVANRDDAVTVRADDNTQPNGRPKRASAPLVAGARYLFGPAIGRGGMGEVRIAHDLQIGRDVAIKQLHGDAATSEQSARLLREARIQGRLEHPAIPPVHELAADADGRPYFVMKKLDGVALADVLRAPAKYPSFTKQRLLNAFVDVCRAIELAHAKGIVHRDLKPGNVVLGDRGEVYVIDWGIARELDVPESPHAPIVGTIGYMPPEQTLGAPDLDTRADVYALGCVLYEILAGQPLHLRRPTPLPPDELPPELDAVVRAATAQDPAERITSVRELTDAVQRYLDGDRDLERRRELARQHYEAARGALASEDDETTRRQTAMRHAGRALALDPTLACAAELVGRLMIVPPAAIPAEVAGELVALDRVEDVRQVKMAAAVAAVLLMLGPFMYAFGVRDAFYLVSYTLASAALLGAQLVVMYTAKCLWLTRAVEIAAEVVQIALFARMFTPLLIAPGFAAVSVMAYAMGCSSARDRRVIAASASLMILVVLGVWVAEPLGWLSQTTWISGGTIVMHSPISGMEAFPTIPALVYYIVALIACAASISHSVAMRGFRTRQLLGVQAWQLRQLL